MANRRLAYRVLVGKPDRRKPLRRARRKREDNIKIDFREVGWKGVQAWTGSIWTRVGTGGGLF